MSKRDIRNVTLGASFTTYDDGHGEGVPQLVLSGQWLFDAGFLIGDEVTVIAEAGMLVIVPAVDGAHAPDTHGEVDEPLMQQAV